MKNTFNNLLTVPNSPQQAVLIMLQMERSYGLALYDNSGWRMNSDSYSIDQSSTLYNTANDRTIEAEFVILNHGGATIEIYENNQVTPTRVKKIKW